MEFEKVDKEERAPIIHAQKTKYDDLRECALGLQCDGDGAKVKVSNQKEALLMRQALYNMQPGYVGLNAKYKIPKGQKVVTSVRPAADGEYYLYFFIVSDGYERGA